MNTRLTVDFGDPIYLRNLKLLASERGASLRELIMEALDNYFSNITENRALLKLAESTFDEWHSEEDKIYDTL